jgi:hypothetical protein
VLPRANCLEAAGLCALMVRDDARALAGLQAAGATHILHAETVL